MDAVSRFVATTAGSRSIISATALPCANGSRPTPTVATCTTKAWGRGSPAIRLAASASSPAVGLVAYALTPEAYEEDCARAVLVVASRGDPPEDCKATVINRALWRQRGALFLSRRGSEFMIESARSKNFDRPWAPAPAPRATPAGAFEESGNSETGNRARDATPRQGDIEADQ
jgi:hypothetical protein